MTVVVFIYNKMHFHILIVIPKVVYENGNESASEYISEVMVRYDEATEVPPYMYKTRAELEHKYFEYVVRNGSSQYDSYEDYLHNYCGYELFDAEGNTLSTSNKEAFYDYYYIGGYFDIFGNMINESKKRILKNDMIVSDKKKQLFSTSVKKYCELFSNDRSEYVYMLIIDKEHNAHENENKDKTVWQDEFESILKESMDDYVVQIHCHV